jgi:hypothetical protein
VSPWWLGALFRTGGVNQWAVLYLADQPSV